MKRQEGMEVQNSLDFGTSLRGVVNFMLWSLYPSGAQGTHCRTEHINPRARINTVKESLSLLRIKHCCSNHSPCSPVTILRVR